MLTYSATTTINASPERVWQALTDASAYPRFDPNAIRIEGTIAAGQTIKAYSKLSPDRAFPVKVSVFEPNKHMEWSSGMPLGLFKGVRAFTITPQGSSVKFTVKEDFSGPMLGMFKRSIPDMNEPFKLFVDGLKAYVEGR